MFGRLASRATKILGISALAGSAVLMFGTPAAQADTITHLSTVNMGNIASVCRAHSGTLIVGSAGTNCILPNSQGTIECWKGLGCDLVTLHVSTGGSSVRAPAPVGDKPVGIAPPPPPSVTPTEPRTAAPIVTPTLSRS